MAEMTDAQILAAWRGGRLKVITQECLGHGSKIALQLRVRELEDRIDELEIRCGDKDASIQQLIEQLEKAEAQNAHAATALEHLLDHYPHAASGCVGCDHAAAIVVTRSNPVQQIDQTDADILLTVMGKKPLLEGRPYPDANFLEPLPDE